VIAEVGKKGISIAQSVVKTMVLLLRNESLIAYP